MLVPIGGFLGVGKTTLLSRAAWDLEALGWRVAAITNDQAGGLVDTASLRASGLRVAEVAGGRFCCRFADLEHAAAELESAGPVGALLAEPVGSCTDLAATVVRPWRALGGRRAAPLSVLIDAGRLAQGIDPGVPGPLPPESAYIVRKQLEEADAIVLTKVDAMGAPARGAAIAALRAAFPGRRTFEVSARTGEGVAEWIQFVLEPPASGGPGERRIDVDYDAYARGEAVLGWLNAEGTAVIAPSGAAGAGTEGADLCASILEELRHSCVNAGGEIAHMKVRLESKHGAVQGHVIAGRAPAEVTGSGASGEVRLVLNARVAMDAPLLERVTHEAIGRVAEWGNTVRLERTACFAPGRPVPTHRM